MAKGTIKTKTDKGYGFISRGDDKKDIFFHSTQCYTPYDQLSVGDNVEFEVESNTKGPRAVNVEKSL